MSETPAEQPVEEPSAGQSPSQAPLGERMAVVRLGQSSLGIAGRHSKEIVQISAFTPLPRTPDYLLGITNLRGDILPFVDLARVLGTDTSIRSSGSNPSLALVVEAAEMRIALAVDAIVTFEPIAVDDGEEPLDATQRDRFGELATATVQHRSGQIILLDIPRLVETLRLRGRSPKQTSDAA